MVTDTDDEEEEGEDNEDSREVTAVAVPQQAPVRLQPAESAPGTEHLNKTVKIMMCCYWNVSEVD